MRRLRNGFDAETARSKSRAIADSLLALAEFKACGNALFYLSLADEVQTDGMIERSLGMNKKVYVPLVDEKERVLKITELPGLDIGFATGRYGIREPESKYWRLVSPAVIDFVVAPGLAFDVNGGRVGYGGGYFDRLFSNCSRGAWRVGVAFDFQVLDAVPQSGFDVPMHKIVTEIRTIACPAV